MKLGASLSGFFSRATADSAGPVTSRAVNRLLQPLGQPRELDPWLIWSAAALLLLGLIMVFSASIATAEGSRMFGHQPAYFLIRHAVFLAIGVIAGVVVFQIPMRAWQEMTPIAEIATLKIGSRPASRTKSDAIEDLRAIPWVFSWAQARVMLPGWYGVGHALHAFADKALLREMAEAWPARTARCSPVCLPTVWPCSLRGMPTRASGARWRQGAALSLLATVAMWPARGLRGARALGPSHWPRHKAKWPPTCTLRGATT